MDKAQRIVAGEYTYKGWQISKMEEGHWNCGPIGEHFTDSHDTLKECKLMIDRQTDIEAHSMTQLDKETIRHISELINAIEVSYYMIDNGYSKERWQESKSRALKELKETYNIGTGA
jgi:DNA-binding ferritin-like protein